MNDNKIINDYLNSQTQCIDKLMKNNTSTIKKIFQVLNKAKKNGRKIYIMGNGGSASTASHFASDLLKTSLTKNTKRIKAFSLSDNMPVILAWANDTSYENIFKEQLESLLEKNDIVIGISGSGNSINVLNAIKFANNENAFTVSFTGKDGGKISKNSQLNLTVPSDDMLTIETMHLLICHLFTTLLRKSGKPYFTY